MRKQDDLAALLGELDYGRSDFLDAGRVGNLAVMHRHIEIDAHEYALALHVGVVEAAKAHWRSLGREFRRACPSPPRYRSCDWRSPIRCRTTTSRGPACRPSPWSGPFVKPRNADRD